MTANELKLMELVVGVCQGTLKTNAAMLPTLRDVYLGQFDQLTHTLSAVQSESAPVPEPVAGGVPAPLVEALIEAGNRLVFFSAHDAACAAYITSGGACDCGYQASFDAWRSARDAAQEGGAV